MPETAAQRMHREVALAAFERRLETLDPWVVDRLTAVLEEEHVSSGQVLWSAGESIAFLYFMIDGRAQARRESAAPWTFEGRWFLGTFEGFDGAPARRSLVALSNFRVLKLRRRAWFDLLEDSFDLMRLFLTSAAAGVARLDERRGTEGALSPQLEVLDRPDEPLSTVERLAFLTEVDLTRSAGVQALADLAANSEEMKVAENAIFLQEGQDREHLFVVVSGQIEARRSNPEVTRRYGAGEVVGGVGSLSDRARAWTARARRETRLLAIPIELWFDLIQEHFDLALSTMAVFAKERETILEQLAAQAGPDGIALRLP